MSLTLTSLIAVLVMLLIYRSAARYDARHDGWASDKERREFQRQHELMLVRSGVYR